MSTKIASAALAALLAVSTAIPAYAGPRGHGGGDNHVRMYRDGGGHGHGHRGGGHWRNGKWIALGILGAAAAAAAASDRDCYYRHGERYCD